MKTKLKAILALLAVLSLGGCNNKDFLTIVPDSDYSVSGSYITKSDFEQAIAAVYSQQQTYYGIGNNAYYIMAGRSDEADIRYPYNPLGYIGGIERFIDDSYNSTHLWTYQTMYKMVNRSNLILDKIAAADFDKTQKDYIKGEALALRAFAYWNLGWQFGGVPLFDKVLSVGEVLQVKRSTQDETFTFAEADYKAAIALLPPSWSGKNLGRATKYAAEAMLARMYMFQNKPAQAKPLLQDIMSCGLYGFESKYIDCFNEGHENGKERIWEVQYCGGQLGEGQSYTGGNLPEKYTGPLQSFNGGSGCTPVSGNMVSAYEVGDVRKNISTVTNVIVSGAVNNTNTFICKYHYADVYVPKNGGDWPVNLPIIRYTDVVMMYAEVVNGEGYKAPNDADPMNPFTILNTVRKRAGLAPLTSADVSDQAAFLKALKKERRVEFAFEGLRWPDLIRWGDAIPVMTDFLGQMSQDGGQYAKNVLPFRLIFPIPQAELDVYVNDKIMWQNPNY